MKHVKGGDDLRKKRIVEVVSPRKYLTQLSLLNANSLVLVRTECVILRFISHKFKKC